MFLVSYDETQKLCVYEKKDNEDDGKCINEF